MLLGNIEFKLVKPDYTHKRDDKYVCVYMWDWVKQLLSAGFEFERTWDDIEDVFVVPLEVFEAAKVYEQGYADMTLAEFVRKTISK